MRAFNFQVTARRGLSVKLALVLLAFSLFIQSVQPNIAKGRGVVLESVIPDVGTAHSFTAVALCSGEEEVRDPLSQPTLGCRFGEHVHALQSNVPGSDSVACLSPSLGPGFVVVGFAHTTGKTYTPGRDDISQELGYNVFEFVQPWRVTSVSPEETYASGGQLLFIQGQHMRPELRCNFLGGARSGVSLQFVSSSLAVCEAEARSPRSHGVLMLQHESHAAPDGQQVTIRHRVMPEITYTGSSTAAFGDDISISSKTLTDEAAPVTLSWQARIGCQFGAVWVASTAQSSPGDIGCTIPASSVGRVQLVVSDLHSRWPLPLANDTASAVDVPNSGRLSLTLRASAIVEIITPTAGTPIVRSNTRTIDVYGRHLVPEMGPLASFCAKLTTSRHEYEDGGPGEVSLKCLLALSAGVKLESAHAFRVGFNAVTIAGGPGDGPSFEAQYLLQNPPQIIATTSSTAYVGDVLTVVGEHFVEAANLLWCITGSSMHAADVVSSAVARCVVPLGNHMPVSTLHRSSAAGQLKIGMNSGETVHSSSNLVSITWSPLPPEVGAVVPNVGFSHGGAQVAVVPAKGGVCASWSRSSVACRFGTIAPVSASITSADAIACTSPALRPGVVSVGAPAPGLFGNAAEYRVLDAPSLLMTASTTVIPSRDGVAEFFISSSAFGSQTIFGCVFPSPREAPLRVYAGAGGYSSCSLPTLQPGFRTLDVAVTHFGTPGRESEPLELGAASGSFSTVPMPHLDHLASVPSKGAGQVHQDIEIQISPPAPTVSVQRHGYSGEMYPGDLLFVVADAGGFSSDLWCLMTTGSSNARYGGLESGGMRATIVSSAVALCEVPFLHTPQKGGLLLDATLSVCSSPVCGGTNALASTQDGAHLAIGAGEKIIVGVSPSRGSSAGGTPVRIRHQGPSLDSSRRHAVCRMGSIGPIAASTAFVGDTVELDCISPAHLPGVVSVALGKGAGWVDDAMLSFTFTEAVDHHNVSFEEGVVDAALIINNAPSTSNTCDDNDDVPTGDILDVKPSLGTSEGGTEIVLHVDATMSQAAVGECGTRRASCRVGTIWPVAGYYAPQGFACITPAHAPGSVDVTAPKMVSGSGRPFAFQNTAMPSASALDEEFAPPPPSPPNNKVVHVKSNPMLSDPGGLVDVTASEMMEELSACIFASPVRASARYIFAAYAHVISSVVLRCEAPAGVVTFGISAREQSQIESSTAVSLAISFSAYREAMSCGVLELTPSTSFTRGGSVAKVTSSCLLGESLTRIDAHLGCRFGSLGPIAASTGEGVHDVGCVTPARAPGTAPFALTTNWRDVRFEPFTSDPGRSARFLYKSDKIGGGRHTADLELPPPMHQSQNALPLMSNVVPWLVWGGNVLHITGRELPNNLNAACLVGSSLVAAIPISSALVLCDPFPIMSSLDRSHLAGGMKEISLSVTSMSSSRQAIDRPGGSSEAAPLTMFVISAAPVMGVDVVDGWEQGGGHVNVELGGWAPMGLMDCHFGTVAVHGREGGGSGWQSRAAMGRGAGEWWSEATVATDVECVTPARRPGTVPIGVSLAHSTSASFGSEKIHYKYV